MSKTIKITPKSAKTMQHGESPALSSREQLISTAAKLFAEQGYNKTNLRDLAEAVGMKAGSIFYHFKGKDEILFAVMHHAISQLLNMVQQRIAKAETPVERLRVLVRSELEHYSGDMSNFGMVLIHEWRSLSAERQANLLDMRREYEGVWRNVLGECHEAGLIVANPRIVRRLLNGAFSWVIHWYDPEGECDFEQLVDEVMAMLVAKRVND